MAVPVTILDTGSGNLRSVAKALAKVGAEPVVSSDPETIRAAERLVVPGQGAFGEFVRAMREHHLEEPLRAFIASGRPFLGICLGLQVLFDESEEQGPVPGLGILPGKVVRFRPADPAMKVPHMGWNQIRRHHGEEPLLAGIDDGEFVYFVHSYYVEPATDDIVALSCDYGGRFAAAVRHGHLFACQFHPEKSQAVGLRLLSNFVEHS